MLKQRLQFIFQCGREFTSSTSVPFVLVCMNIYIYISMLRPIRPTHNRSDYSFRTWAGLGRGIAGAGAHAVACACCAYVFCLSVAFKTSREYVCVYMWVDTYV